VGCRDAVGGVRRGRGTREEGRDEREMMRCLCRKFENSTSGLISRSSRYSLLILSVSARLPSRGGTLPLAAVSIPPSPLPGNHPPRFSLSPSLSLFLSRDSPRSAPRREKERERGGEGEREIYIYIERERERERERQPPLPSRPLSSREAQMSLMNRLVCLYPRLL